MRTIPFFLMLTAACTGGIDETDLDTEVDTSPDTESDTGDIDTEVDTEDDSDRGELPDALSLAQVGSGFSRPVGVTSRPGDDRLWVVEQDGFVRPITADGTPGDALVDISTRISSGNEQGLLGLAFPPDHATTGRFYVHYTRRDGNSILARYTVDPDNTDSAPDDNREVLWVVDQPYANHNAGHIAFGPDGYLYVGYGDGGLFDDPLNAGQDTAQILGKMLRVDVSDDTGYSSPSDNPFTGDDAIDDRIWSLGLRNPWKFAFDGLTGDLYIGDVGQREWEEISFQPANSTGGENYGWSVAEGNHCFADDNCDMSGLVPALHEYDHGDGCSITGGEVYRGQDYPALDGTYFFSDYCTSQLWSFRYDNGAAVEFTNWTDSLNITPTNVSSFGVDANGEVYVVSLGSGQIHQITVP